MGLNKLILACSLAASLAIADGSLPKILTLQNPEYHARAVGNGNE